MSNDQFPSGGNLAAIVALKATTLTPPIPLIFQLLVVPVTDNTASLSGKPHVSWKENANTAWLPPDRMIWFRKNYLPDQEDWTKWDSSPMFAPHDLFAKAPKTWIGVGERDILRDEAIAFGEKLTKAGVDVETKIYKNAPHPIMAMDGRSYYTLYMLMFELIKTNVHVIDLVIQGKCFFFYYRSFPQTVLPAL